VDDGGTCRPSPGRTSKDVEVASDGEMTGIVLHHIGL
jgi:hypothetical protein